MRSVIRKLGSVTKAGQCTCASGKSAGRDACAGGMFICGASGMRPCGRILAVNSCLGLHRITRTFGLGRGRRELVVSLGRFGSGSSNDNASASRCSKRKGSGGRQGTRTCALIGRLGALAGCCRSPSVLVLKSLGTCSERSPVQVLAGTSLIGLLRRFSPRSCDCICGKTVNCLSRSVTSTDVDGRMMSTTP